MKYVLFYTGIGYVAYDANAEGGAGGYRFAKSISDAVTFDSQSRAADFLEVSGPPWAQDMAKKGLLTIKEKS